MWAYITSAVWFGWLMAISPCPMATNIAAVSFIGKDAGNTGRVLFSGCAYALGRTLAYTVLAVLLCGAVLDQPAVARFLQDSMNNVLGPLMILVGMVLLELISLPMPSPAAGGWARKLAAHGGVLAAGLLGVLFALSFCPISAVWYLALLEATRQSGLTVLLPAVFGVTTAVPVVLFAVLIAVAAGQVGRVFNAFSRMEKWLRTAAGIIFIVVGILYCLTYIFEVQVVPNT